MSIKRSAITTVLVCAVVTRSFNGVTSFSPQFLSTAPHSNNALNIQRPFRQTLYLHPNQAQELEAAASEIFSQNKQDEDGGDDEDYTNESSSKYQDDTKHDKESSLSAASATFTTSTSKQGGSWSKSFFSFISRQGRT